MPFVRMPTSEVKLKMRICLPYLWGTLVPLCPYTIIVDWYKVSKSDIILSVMKSFALCIAKLSVSFQNMSITFVMHLSVDCKVETQMKLISFDNFKCGGSCKMMRYPG